MNEIIMLEEGEEFKVYNPIVVLTEDEYLDNRFCIIKTIKGNIAFSYYDLGVKPSVLIQNGILFLSFGKSYYIIDLLNKKILYQSNDTLSVVLEIVKNTSRSCVVFIGEMSLLCFSFEGQLMWKNNYRNIIYDWTISEEEISIVFEDGGKMLVSLENGNGIQIT